MDTSPSPVDAAPDWESIAEPVCCPLCEYDLRGIRDPRCPECGYTFAWAEILDPARRLHPYLFEHHPERRARSFRRTFLGALRPRRFWTTLHPAQPSYPRRLLLYWVLTSLMCYVVMAGPGVGRMVWDWHATLKANVGLRAQVLAYYTSNKASPQECARLIQTYGSLENAVNTEYPTRMTWSSFARLVRWCLRGLVTSLLPTALPWLTFACLMIFQMSMRRARVRPAHVMRCAIYTGGTYVWGGLAVGISILIGPVLWRGSPFRAAVLREATATACLLVCLAITYQLIVAYRRYLRFPHAVATVLAAQFVAMLALVTFLQVFGIMPF